MIEMKHPLLAKAVLMVALGVAPLALSAQPSNTNHGSQTGINNANQNGLNNSNINGIGGTAPVPEASTWAAMGAALVVAGVLVLRRRRLLHLG